MSTGESRVTTAEAALASAKRKQDKAAEVMALQDCIKAYIDLPDSFEALKAAKAMWKLQKDLGDTKGQAQALLKIGEMHFALNNLEDALKNEQEALELFKTVGDNASQETAKEALSLVHNKLGQVDLAPNRSKGLAALSELTRAIEAKDPTRFQEAMSRCKRMSSVSDADIEEKLAEALESDYLPTAKLFKDCLDMDGLLPEAKGIVVDKKYHYYFFRTNGGLHYGPAFQCVQGATVNFGQDEIMAPVVIPETQETWEFEVAYNAGLLDGFIQVPFSGGLMEHVVDQTNKEFAKFAAQSTFTEDGHADQGAIGY